MSLNAFSFVLFLPLIVGINFLIPRKYRYIWLFAASYFFYLSNDVRFLAGLGACTAVTYVTGLLLEKTRGVARRVLLVLCIFLNISFILLRYMDFESIIVPMGMSFYGLQALGYVIDVYRNQLEAEKNPVRYALFVSFFPTVMSGPIQRGSVLLGQIREGRNFDYSRARAGLYDLLWGYLLKLVIANRLGGMVDYAFGRYETMPGATMVWATVLYGIQLYCDFAGYSALAIGTGKILGFDLGINFARPYFATSIKEFWKRWHISLSSWLNDYVYIPLGGNRKGRCRKYVNLMITFLVSGLWHGAGMNFLVWGALHGIYQILGGCLPKKTDRKRGGFYRAVQTIFTFVLVDFAWLFFRADSMIQAFSILRRICFHFNLREMTYYGSYLLGDNRKNLLLVLVGIGLVFLVDLLCEKKISIVDVSLRVPMVVRWLVYIILTLLILYVVVYHYGLAGTTFLYGRF